MQDSKLKNNIVEGLQDDGMEEIERRKRRKEGKREKEVKGRKIKREGMGMKREKT